MIDVKSRATGGNGRPGNPWTGWDAAGWTSNQAYYFEAGHYVFSNTLGWGKDNIHIVGDGIGTVLRFTGSGVAVDASVTTGQVWGAIYENFKLLGNANCTKLFRAVNNFHIRVSNVLARVATGVAFEFEGVLGQLDNVRYFVNEILDPTIPNIDTNSHRPATGFLFRAYAFTVNQLIAEGATGNGLHLSGPSTFNVFNGGTSESNGRGVQIDLTCSLNTFIALDFEGNPTQDVRCEGFYNVFMNINSNGMFELPKGANANANRLLGGYYNRIAIGTGSGCDPINNVLRDVVYNSGGAGGLDDRGVTTVLDHVRDAKNAPTAQTTGFVQRIRIIQQRDVDTPFIPTVSAASGLGSTGSTVVDPGSSDSLTTITLKPAGSGIEGNGSGFLTVTWYSARPFPSAVPFLVAIDGTAAWDDVTLRVAIVSENQFKIFWKNNQKLTSNKTYRIGVFSIGK